MRRLRQRQRSADKSVQRLPGSRWSVRKRQSAVALSASKAVLQHHQLDPSSEHQSVPPNSHQPVDPHVLPWLVANQPGASVRLLRQLSKQRAVPITLLLPLLPLPRRPSQLPLKKKHLS